MSEEIIFHFEGLLSEHHNMNFYEAARFQYAAARLLVKLSQFRRTGKFSKKISHKSNCNIITKVYSEGSFNINIEDFSRIDDRDAYINSSLGDLISYSSEMILRKNSNNENNDQILTENANSHINDLVDKVLSGDLKIDEVSNPSREIVKRRISEINREYTLEKNKDILQKISDSDRIKIMSMSAPLIKEMAVALRESADTLEVSVKDGHEYKSILYIDKNIASEISLESVDEEISLFDVDIIQFNKDNGSGKLKLLVESESKIINFNITYYELKEIKESFIEKMKKNSVKIRTYPVRDSSKEIKRLIIVGFYE